MPIKELRELYGPAKNWQVLNRAIRAEIPGGNELLDALPLADVLRRRSPDGEKLFNQLDKARVAMKNFIARKYDFKSTREENAENGKEI